MAQITDSEMIARLIYRVFVQPQPGLLADDDALVPFPDALELYAKTRMRELIEDGALAPVSEPDTPADDTVLKALGTEPHIAGYASAEKKEIFARLHAFCATHGLGARKMIADASAGALTISELLDMMSSARVQLAKWRAAAAAMDRIEEKENGTAEL